VGETARPPGVSIEEGLRSVRERIGDAALRSGRDSAAITLVGCKPPTTEDVLQALAHGLTEIGENRVQEAAAKAPEVAQRANTAVRWHLIGHLQTKKVKAALELFGTVQSVDSLRLAHKLSETASTPLRAFLEVQFVQQPDRYGFTADTIGDAFDTIAGLPRIDVAALMTVAPLGLDPDQTRRVFRTLREIRDRIEDAHPDRAPLGLSMGMTNDYEIAIEEGATVVRIGRAIFGS
jgi:PLP dependent protein